MNINSNKAMAGAYDIITEATNLITVGLKRNKKEAFLNMKNTLLFLALAVLILSSKAESEELFKPGETLSLERCLELALKNQPNIVAYWNSVKAAESRLGEAQSGFFPQASFSAGYNQTKQSVEVVKPNPVPPFGTTTETVDKISERYSASLGVSQTIFDFGKTYFQTKAQSNNLESAKMDLENITLQVAFNVKQAYYQLLVAMRDLEVSQETVKQFEQHLEQAKGFYEAGKKPKFDVTKAEVDLSNAKLNLIKMENALEVAKVNLKNAMGIPDSPDFSIEDNLEFERYEINFEQAKSKAFESRPDLKSSLAKENAAKNSVKLAWTGYAPSLSGTAAYQWAGEDLPMDDGWSVGLNLNFPIFNGFLTQHQVNESKANLNIARANQELLKQSVLLEVQQAYLNLKAAEQSIPAAELAVKSAEENLELANARYSAGVGSPIEVTDAQVAYANAQLNYIQALYDYKIAQASLIKAMGEK